MPNINKYAICTIIAKNYIAFARTLCESFQRQHPEGKCYVLAIDDIAGYIEASKENFELIQIHDLNIPNLKEFCFKYNITELCTATKPYFLKYLLDNKRIDKLFYLDPDILVINSLSNLFDQLDSNDIILTPHLDKDYPDDGLLPNDAHIMKSGIFNLGFIGLRKCPNVDTFLFWWQHKLYDKCVIAHTKGYFVDQKFIDLAISLFPNIFAIKETGYNVAYWNLHSRNIHSVNNAWLCNNEKLYFYHFSAFKPELPNSISIHQSRYKLEDLPELKNLFDYYYNLLVEKEYFKTKDWPYTYAYFTNETIVVDWIRKLYRSKWVGKIDDPFDIKSFSIRIRILFKIIRFSENVHKKFLKKLMKKLLSSFKK
jgi:hypothetical protein